MWEDKELIIGIRKQMEIMVLDISIVLPKER